MLVEDDPMIAEIYMKKFSAAGFEMTNATTGKEVLKLAGENKFDLILLDMVIPELTGLEVLKELKHSGNYVPVPRVVVFSNLNETDTQTEALKLGADGFIGKSEHSPSEIVEEVKRLLVEFSEKEKHQVGSLASVAPQQTSPAKRVLLIEDEEIFLEMFGKKLEDVGFEVGYASNGAWGLKEALENKYDIVVTDIVMPALSGEEIIQKLHEDEKTAKIPVIVLSASVDQDVQKRVEDMGIADFFVKTKIVPSDLSRRIEELIGPARS